MAKDSNSSLSITYLPITILKPDPKNARVHSDRQLKMLARSIKSLGFNVPIIIDGGANVIAGHARLQAAQSLGLKEVPTICLQHLTEAQLKAYRIADNRLAEMSTWDDQLLAEQLKDLAGIEVDFSLEVTGFTMGEIDLRITGQEKTKKDPDDAIPSIGEGAGVTKPGDLFLLGKHRIYCGSALEASSYHQLMEGRHAAMVFIDPPYNVKIDGHVGGMGAIKHREFPMASGEMGRGEFTDFLRKAFSSLVQHSLDGSIHYVCMDWRHLGELLEAGDLTYTELKNLCVWVKDNGGMGSLYRSQHELVAVYKHGTAAHRNNVQLGQYGRYRSNVWKYAGANCNGWI